MDVEEAQKEDVREGEWDEEPDFVVECVTLGDKLVEIEGVTETVPLAEPDKQCVVLSLNVGVEEAHNVVVRVGEWDEDPDFVTECVTLGDELVEIEDVKEAVPLEEPDKQCVVLWVKVGVEERHSVVVREGEWDEDFELKDEGVAKFVVGKLDTVVVTEIEGD